MPEPLFFPSAQAWRKWLEKHHASETELIVGFYKRDSGKLNMTWPESVDAALCFGWIDGVRRSINQESYSIRFTPRKPTSTWSRVNINRVRELLESDLMHPAGTKAFEARRDARSEIYAFEQDKIQLDATQQRQFKANKKAWEYFQARPPWYRRTATWWVISAKQPKTREKRLATLISDSAEGRTIAQLTRKPNDRS